MSVAPVTEHDAGGESSGKRRIGDILLELGFVAEEALATAAEEQARTGQPLGQILVEHGVITRLELASALAEQWSDQVSITPLPLPSMTCGARSSDVGSTCAYVFSVIVGDA